eukprot:15043951-Alexandrium_andersonii.AAC.1
MVRSAWAAINFAKVDGSYVLDALAAPPWAPGPKVGTPSSRGGAQGEMQVAQRKGTAMRRAVRGRRFGQ